MPDDLSVQTICSSSSVKTAIEINASSRASTVKLAKAKAITHLLTYATAFLGHHFRVTQRKSLEIRTCSVTKGRTLSS